MRTRSLLATALLSAGLASSIPKGMASDAEEIRELRRQVQLMTERLAALEARQTPSTTTTTPAPTPPISPAQPSVESLDQQVRILQRQRELDQEAAAEKAKTTPLISLGSAGLSVRSADTNFVFRLRGYVQADARWYFDDVPAPGDTFLIRRVRPIFEGTVYDRFDYRVMLDFGSGQSSSAANIGWLQDAYVNARLSQGLQIRVGKDKEPVGLERLQSGSNLLFVERAFPTLLLPNRDVGAQVRGEFASGALEYQVGVFNGVADGGSGDVDRADEDKDFTARVFSQPFRNSDGFLRGLGIGLAGTYGDQGGALRSFTSPGQQTAFAYLGGSGTATSPSAVADGAHWRLTPQAWFYRGPFGLLAEYAVSQQEVSRVAGPGSVQTELQHTAWQVAASWFLTGEENSFRAVTPRQTFRLGDAGLGALELAARVSGLDLDEDTFPLFANPDSSISSAFEWAVGMNWHLNRFVKVSLTYSQTEFDGAERNPAVADGERTLLGRIQFGF